MGGSMEFVDIHIHALSGVDDGAESAEEMYSMLDMAYADGTRSICFTPHCNPGYWGNNRAKSLEAFELAQKYAKDKYPDLSLFLGNELRYSSRCISWLSEGIGRTLNGTRYVLIDFSFEEDRSVIVDCVTEMLGRGYLPILAHAERYSSFHSDLREVRLLAERGIMIQVDSQSLTGDFGRKCKKRAVSIIKHRLAHIVASDGHNTEERPPLLSKAFEIVSDMVSPEYAESLLCKAPRYVISSK